MQIQASKHYDSYACVFKGNINSYACYVIASLKLVLNQTF